MLISNVLIYTLGGLEYGGPLINFTVVCFKDDNHMSKFRNNALIDKKQVFLSR